MNTVKMVFLLSLVLVALSNLACKADSNVTDYNKTESLGVIQPPPALGFVTASPEDCKNKLNEEFAACGSGDCQEKCNEPPGPPKPCLAMCFPGCYCKPGFVRDDSGKCVAKNDCQAQKTTPSTG